MKGKKHIFSLFLVMVLLCTSVFQAPVCLKAKGSTRNTKYYTISKKAGTYKSTIRVKVKAKKGYRVYYKTSGKFKKTKVIKAGKSKTFVIKKTTLLSLCAVKKTARVTNKKLNTTFRKKKTAYYANYKYKITKGTAPQGTPPAGGTMPGETSPSGTATANPEEINEAQEKLDEAESGSNVAEDTAVTAIPSVKMDDNTAAAALSSDGIDRQNVTDNEIAYEEQGDVNILTIQKAGTYVLSGGTALEPVTNTEIIVSEDALGEVNLIWDSLIIDNSGLGKETGEDVPVFNVNSSASEVHVTLKGSSVLTGNGTYSDSPAAAIICAGSQDTVLTFSAYEGDTTASLTVRDAMDADTDFGEYDPSDGIYSKGTLAFGGGTYSITACGDCLKGTGKKGKGGIQISGGTFTLRSELGNAMKSKNGNILIHGGNVSSTYTADDGINAKNYSVIITGGTITLDQCYGDGIQGENVNISGEDTVIDITTYFENAGINYYNSALGTGKYNSMSSTNTSKTEVVRVDTGSHKGIKGGTKAHTYSYKTVEDGSSNTAGTTYTTEASGGIVISGGTITIDTTNTGIKYNGSSGGMGGGRASSSGGNLSAANADGQYIIGSPDDGIHSNHTCTITGGTLNISSSDDGITGPSGIIIMNDSDITINKCYEGIEGGEIMIGSSTGASAEPAVKIYSDDDGVNAASKSAVNYVYEDESEETYTKTETASNNNTLKILGGYLNVMLGDDTSHSFSLSTASGTKTTGSYQSDGDGIDCNGSFYAYGGTVVVFGANSEDNSPIDTESGYFIGSGVTILAVGKSGMAESPSKKEQPVVVYGSTSGGFGGMRPGQGGNSTFSANTAFAIMKDGDVLLAIKPVKTYNYVMYSSPELENGSSYTMYSGGGVSGSKVCADSAYDYRYTGYNTSGATLLSTVTG